MNEGRLRSLAWMTVPRLKSRRMPPRPEIADESAQDTDERDPDFVESLARGLKVILAFGRDRTALTVSDVARLTELPKPAARRMLHTLAQLGYARSDGRLFSLTPQVLSLAAAYLGTDLISTVLQPTCERVMAEVGESCFAAVIDGQDIVMIAHANRRFPLGLVPSTGLRLPILSTAAGRVMLGRLSDTELEQALATLPWPDSTKHAVKDRAAVRKAIVQGRKDGYGVTRQEALRGFWAVAVPLQRADGKQVGALSIAARADRCEQEPGLVDRLAAVLKREAAALATQLV